VEPDFIRGYIEENATYLMCSDGFRHKITPEEIMEKLGPESVTDEASMKRGCEYLTELVKYRKETDNITVLLISTK
jgi:serine/threonine protein phosphatase PrpC